MFGNDGAAAQSRAARASAAVVQAPAPPPIPADQLALVRAQQQQAAYDAQVRATRLQADQLETRIIEYNQTGRRDLAIKEMATLKRLRSVLSGWENKRSDIDAQIVLLQQARANAAHVAVTAELQTAVAGISNIDAGEYEKIRDALTETQENLNEIEELTSAPIGEPMGDMALTNRERADRLDTDLDDLLAARATRDLATLPFPAIPVDARQPTGRSPAYSTTTMTASPPQQARVAVTTTATANAASPNSDRLRQLASKMRQTGANKI